MEYKINSLIEQANNEEETIKKIELYCEISKELEYYDINSSFDFAVKGYSLSKKVNYIDGVTECLYRKGRCTWLKGDYNKSIDILNKAIIVAEKNNLYKNQVEIYNNLGNVYVSLVNYDKAYNYYLKALKVEEDNYFTSYKYIILNNIGIIYSELGNYEKSLEYYFRSQMESEAVKNEKFVSIPLINIASVYNNQKKYGKAFDYTNKSLIICEKYNDKIGIAHAYNSFSEINLNQNKKKEALKNLKNALKVAKEVGSKDFEVKILLEINKILMEEKAFIEIFDNLQQALTIYNEEEKDSQVAEIYKQYAFIYEEIGKCEVAYKYLKKYIDIEKKILNTDTEERLKSINLLYKSEEARKENEIFQLKNVELKRKKEELEKAYNNIRIISEIGKNIISTTNIGKILSQIYSHINKLMDSFVFGIGIYDEENQKIYNEFFIEDNKRQKKRIIDLNDPKSYTAWCMRNRKKIFISNQDLEYKQYVEEKSFYTLGEKTKSLIYCPLIVEKKLVGVITVQSLKENAFNTNTVDIIEALSSYIAIAIKNAQKSEALSKEIKEKEEAQTKLVSLNSKLLNLSQIDGLTGVANRRRFDDFLDDVWNICRRKNTVLSVAIIDIDFFKEYNDNYGHILGDYIIKVVAKTLDSTLVRNSDLIARYGGDEFIAVMPDTDIDGIKNICTKMIENINQLNIEHRFSKISNKLTLSIGAACIIPDSDECIEKFLQRADIALYKAKAAGRNRLTIFSEEIGG
ncbi:sensor domain-containing diguanylate cyclase [Clostridium grantii]|uniref:Diguanylate cyclase (GGDEF) domain-containing protein n=1 Tax=Clostridium grantii DSM 8605 TaxID=1121316 RepID=A0A1M5Y083_9CLOT|nr:diguanylate cyclase [Clostridium grantii]SHI05402.1 diguanylate cyclase (GGDEF) domain-containing protein [Clostridium grantii DSM 8605]